MHCKHIISTFIIIYFRFKYIPPRKFKYGLWKGVYTRLFGIEKFPGKCFLEHFISNFHINHIMHCKHVILTFCMYFRFKYTPPRKFNYGLWKGVYLRLFVIEKFPEKWKFDIKCSKKQFPGNFSMPKRRK